MQEFSDNKGAAAMSRLLRHGKLISRLNEQLAAPARNAMENPMSNITMISRSISRIACYRAKMSDPRAVNVKTIARCASRVAKYRTRVVNELDKIENPLVRKALSEALATLNEAA
jgi:hypothetical protein